jgi:hypothetical protein
MEWRAGRILGGGVAAAALVGIGYVAWTWRRYGRVEHRGGQDPLLDRFLPVFEVAERHRIAVAAPAPVTFAAALRLDLERSPVVRAIFAGRELLMRATPAPDVESGGFLSRVLSLGWGILAEDPGREIVLGAVTQPWEANVKFRSLPPGEFAAFGEPGYAKIVWNLAVDPLGPGRSACRTETRVATTDPESRRRFRRYWSLVSPGVRLIRWETLRLIRRDAEQRRPGPRSVSVAPAAAPESGAPRSPASRG